MVILRICVAALCHFACVSLPKAEIFNMLPKSPVQLSISYVNPNSQASSKHFCQTHQITILGPPANI